MPRYFAYCRKSSEAEDRQVMSLDSQRAEVDKLAARLGLTVVECLFEAQSAKSPGRPVFNDMIARIEAGEANGIVTWAPDRLARNSIDGGHVIYMLDRSVLKDLKFVNYSFENNSQGKFMLQIMFGQSKYYSDALSEVVKRGNRAKLEAGWLPNLAPLGYLNDRNTKTIIPDPQHFPLVRRIFEMVGSGAYTPSQVLRIARDEWGFRTPKRRKIGGVPISQSVIYKMLSNPFYAGVIVWGDQVYRGKHEPVVTLEEFESVRARLQKTTPARVPPELFAYTGMIRCGACGLSVTAERKRNRFGNFYVYYHCTRRQPVHPCRQPSVEVGALEAQIVKHLSALQLAAPFVDWLDEDHEEVRQIEATQEEAKQTSLLHAKEAIEAQLRELTSLRIRGLVDDTDFVARRTELQQEQIKVDQAAERPAEHVDTFEPIRTAANLSKYAVDWFESGTNQLKREIFALTMFEPILENGKLRFEATKPFNQVLFFSNIPQLLAGVRTTRQKRAVRARVAKMVRAAPLSLAEYRQLKDTAARIEALAERDRKNHVPKVPEVRRLARGRRRPKPNIDKQAA